MLENLLAISLSMACANLAYAEAINWSFEEHPIIPLAELDFTSDEVIEKMLYEHELFGHDRFIAQMGVGPQPHAEVLKAIELLGTKVAPVVRAEIAKRKAPQLVGA